MSFAIPVHILQPVIEILAARHVVTAVMAAAAAVALAIDRLAAAARTQRVSTLVPGPPFLTPARTKPQGGVAIQARARRYRIPRLMLTQSRRTCVKRLAAQNICTTTLLNHRWTASLSPVRSVLRGALETVIWERGCMQRHFLHAREAPNCQKITGVRGNRRTLVKCVDT